MNKVSVTIDHDDKLNESHSKHMDAAYYDHGDEWILQMGMCLGIVTEHAASVHWPDVLAHALTVNEVESVHEQEVEELVAAAVKYLKSRNKKGKS
jgi:hypothetical protein